MAKNFKNPQLAIPRRELLPDTTHGDDEDPLKFYYSFPYNYIYKRRLSMPLSLMNKHYNSLLEIGYGSGIFLPSLSKIAKDIYGLDIHPFENKVCKAMKNLGVNANLVRGDLFKMPYKNNSFNAIVCMSTLEHIEPIKLKNAVQEFSRVLIKGGDIYLGVPAKNKITDIFFEKFCKVKLDAGDMHKSSPKDVITAVKTKFKIDKIITFPLNMPLSLSFYVVIKATRL